MRLIFLLLAVLTLALPNASAASSVTLELKFPTHLSPVSLVTCNVTISTPTNGAAVLDAATTAGCISGWQYEDFGSPGHPDRFVTCINGLCQEPLTSWWYYINDTSALGGVDNTNGLATIYDGSTITFVYADWFTPCIDLSDPCGLGLP